MTTAGDTPDGPEARSESLRRLEAEVGVLIRRIRRVIHERARAVHAEMQPSAYLLLAWLADEGPVRASAIAESFGIDKGAISRQLQHLVDLGLVTRSPDPDDGRATLVAASDDAVRRMTDVAAHRRKWLDEQLGDWSAAELNGFVDSLARYNEALND
ncbi:MarR family transcriptional regulator [Nocardioides sp.]|uniref:MarR family winged helix-turn-helix transcriptional regulator n=1 Tax=Nocardioides sp. TaxID=35761 RepID=UPI001A2DE45C|nr:MarR family transcriptional regulator [Nocardioides sp.]MBJ7358936.1 MarR family transcriptional regulator [Nocardioides sp.]